MRGSTHRAVWVARQADVAPTHVTAIEHQQSADGCLARAAEELQCLRCLHTADDAHQRRKYSHGGATGLFKDRIRWKNASVAGRLRLQGVVDRQLPIEADGGTGNQWHAMVHAGRINSMARCKIVAAVQHHISVCHQNIKARSSRPFSQRSDSEFRVDSQHRLASRLHLGLAHPRLRVGNLALQIGQVYRVVVNQGQVTNPGRG